ncbi:hypothetical protein GCM10022240_13530 [Microbacterium kribbense]|uniref:Uncharacterized protein n=1 Tax=Microbacterium kribbense TaxID=433645 RepID=A0ABP7GDK9_9MICO
MRAEVRTTGTDESPKSVPPTRPPMVFTGRQLDSPPLQSRHLQQIAAARTSNREAIEKQCTQALFSGTLRRVENTGDP